MGEKQQLSGRNKIEKIVSRYGAWFKRWV